MMRMAMLIALGWGVPLPAVEDNDELLSAWRFRRAVTLTDPGESRFAELKLPLEVLAAAGPLQRDVRLIGPDGMEIRYLIDREKSRESRRTIPGYLVDTNVIQKETSTWTIDLASSFVFDEITLDIPDQDFAKRLRIEVADLTDGPWRTIGEDVGVFNHLWVSRVHHTAIPLKAAEAGRLLRITADDRTSPKIHLRGAAATGGAHSPGERWRYPCALEPASSPDPRRNRFVFRLPPTLPMDAFEVTADDPLFLRTVSLIEQVGNESSPQENRLGRGLIYRMKIDTGSSLKDWLQEKIHGTKVDATSPVGESLLFPVEPPGKATLLLEIDNGDNPPLKNVRASALGMAVRLIFPADAAGKGPLTLYYGNATCRAPTYDLEVLRTRLSEYRTLPPAKLGPESPNPKHREAPPLPFVPTTGAPLEEGLWKWTRPLSSVANEGLYAVTLTPEDLSLLRPDLGDLRIADREDRQIPFLLDGRSSDAEVRLIPVSQHSSRRSVSRFRLDLPTGPGGKPMILPVDTILVEIAEPFFSRMARLLTPAVEGWRHEEQTLFAGLLERRNSESSPLRINLKGVRLGTMLLEIEDGDNAPLTVSAATASIPVARALFKRKAEPVECRLLLGNPESSLPRYDIEALRREVLACPAIPLDAGPLAPNPAYRHEFSDTLRKAPPTLILWGGLIAAVIGLLILTIRLLRKAAE